MPRIVIVSLLCILIGSTISKNLFAWNTEDSRMHEHHEFDLQKKANAFIIPPPDFQGEKSGWKGAQTLCALLFHGNDETTEICVEYYTTLETDQYNRVYTVSRTACFPLSQFKRETDQGIKYLIPLYNRFYDPINQDPRVKEIIIKSTDGSNVGGVVDVSNIKE